MEKNLEAYVLTFDNWLDPKVCEQTVQDLEKVRWTEHQFYEPSEGYHKRSGNQELDISYENVTTKEYIMERTWYALQKYLQTLERW